MFIRVMRPTGEASKPVSGDFVCRIRNRLFVIGLRRRLAEPLAPGFVALQLSRVDSVKGS
jgi:hypothetical protein